MGTLINSAEIEKCGEIFWKPILKTGVAQEDVFRIYKANVHEIWETRFLLNCLPIVKKGIQLLKMMNSEEELTHKYALKFSRKTDLDLFKECLQSLIDFVFSDPFPQSELSYSLKKPNKTRQKILRELGFLELLAQIVDNAFPNSRILGKVEQIRVENGFEVGQNNNYSALKDIKSSKIVSSRKSLWMATKKTILGKLLIIILSVFQKTKMTQLYYLLKSVE